MTLPHTAFDRIIYNKKSCFLDSHGLVFFSDKCLYGVGTIAHIFCRDSYKQKMPEMLTFHTLIGTGFSRARGGLARPRSGA